MTDRVQTRTVSGTDRSPGYREIRIDATRAAALSHILEGSISDRKTPERPAPGLLFRETIMGAAHAKNPNYPVKDSFYFVDLSEFPKMVPLRASSLFFSSFETSIAALAGQVNKTWSEIHLLPDFTLGWPQLVVDQLTARSGGR